VDGVLVFFAETLWVIVFWVREVLRIVMDAIHGDGYGSAYFHFVCPTGWRRYFERHSAHLQEDENWRIHS
jgi:hypothetical protein